MYIFGEKIPSSIIIRFVCWTFITNTSFFTVNILPHSCHVFNLFVFEQLCRIQGTGAVPCVEETLQSSSFGLWNSDFCSKRFAAVVPWYGALPYLFVCDDASVNYRLFLSYAAVYFHGMTIDFILFEKVDNLHWLNWIYVRLCVNISSNMPVAGKCYTTFNNSVIEI